MRENDLLDPAIAAADTPLDEDELLTLAAGLERLPLDEAAWVARVFGECRRARAAEAELLASSRDASSEREALAEDIAQIVLDAAEWLKTLWAVGYMGASHFSTEPRSEFPDIEVEDILKSALLSRIRNGKRPLPFPPPTRQGVPWHEVVEHPGPFAVNAALVVDDVGLVVGAAIEGCIGWQLVDPVTGGDACRVQHQGKGPIYRLLIAADPGASTLIREAPTWTRRVVAESRGGMTRYLLEWPREDGTLRSIPLRAATWDRAESEASYWIASKHPEMYGQVTFERGER